ncbi:MAG: Mu transposase C-terminal domain-containing protein [Candidatus Cloacimonas sp.]|jgi:putative transposase|nr:Mu transposase C-terminal domain-containing protein [Candidatus Cloacimonas sp.]
MSFYDFTVEEYAEFLKKELAGTDIVPMGIMTPCKRGRKPKQLEQAISTTRMEQSVPSPLYREENAELDYAESQVIPAIDLQPERTAQYIDFTPYDQIFSKFNGEAKLYGHFCTVVLDRLADSESRVAEWEKIASEYNNGTLVPELYKLRGNRTERALRLWIERYQEARQDMYALIHRGRNKEHRRKVTDQESALLLQVLLHPNQVSVGSAISALKTKARMGWIASPSSVPTLRRWCKEWEADNPAIWNQTRKGSKYVAEHIIKTIMRDSNVLDVGEVWVADGHTLAFDIFNPKTGKAQRMTMIMVLDWASRYPVGASLAFTEDSQHIQIAFRNGFLNWGALPKFVYLDNGKAFKSKLFHEAWEAHDLEVELGGIFPKLNIGAQFAASYNAKAKVIERFFLTFQEQFERFVSSFRGSCIDNKPAPLMRNEKWAQKLYKSVPPTIEEAMQMIGFYVRYVYGETPHGGLGGKTPWQVFSSAPLPQERLVQPCRLNFMMLSAERKAVRNDGIVFNKLRYWHPALIDLIGKPVIFRYDLADARWILVYDTKDVFICQAELRQTQHPFIKLAMDQPLAHKALKQEYTYIKKLQRGTEQRSKLFVKKNQETVDALLEPYQRLIATAQNPTFIQAPALEAPEPGPEQFIANLEHQVTKLIEDRPIPEIPVQDDSDKTDLTEKEDQAFDSGIALNDSFKEMCDFIGIKQAAK